MPGSPVPTSKSSSSIYIATQISTTAEDPTKDASEIIEIAWSLIDSSTLSEIHRESVLIKPINTPISPLCTSTTTLTWDSVKNAGTLKDAVETFDKSIEKHILAEKRPFSFVTFNSWDLRMKLPKESREKSIKLPRYLEYARLFDLKKEFVKLEEYLHPEFFTSNTLNQVTLNQVVSTLDINLSDIKPVNESYAESFNLGTPRRAGDDVQIMSKILVKLIQTAPVHLSLLKRPHDLGLDMNQFISEASRILYMTNLPVDTTQSELESWFTQFGGRPIAFWTIKSPSGQDMGNGSNGGSNHSSRSNSTNGSANNLNKPTCSGFSIFATHEEAYDSLGMTGRVLNDRVIEVQPSSSKVLEKAQEILTPFPSSKNRPRPGDWTCPSCGFSNFQRRTACFRCSFPAASAATIQGSIYGGTQNMNNNNNNNQVNKLNYYNNNNSVNVNHHQQQQSMHHNSNNNNNKNYHHNTHHNNNNNGNGSYNNNRQGQGNHNNSSNVPFRAGDWKCINESCAYHNFAKNICCLKCGAPRVQSAILNGHPHDQHHPHNNNNNHNNSTANQQDQYSLLAQQFQRVSNLQQAAQKNSLRQQAPVQHQSQDSVQLPTPPATQQLYQQSQQAQQQQQQQQHQGGYPGSQYQLDLQRTVSLTNSSASNTPAFQPMMSGATNSGLASTPNFAATNLDDLKNLANRIGGLNLNLTGGSTNSSQFNSNQIQSQQQFGLYGTGSGLNLNLGGDAGN